jgi:hypothetical protein
MTRIQRAKIIEAMTNSEDDKNKKEDDRREDVLKDIARRRSAVQSYLVPL